MGERVLAVVIQLDAENHKEPGTSETKGPSECVRLKKFREVGGSERMLVHVGHLVCYVQKVGKSSVPQSPQVSFWLQEGNAV